MHRKCNAILSACIVNAPIKIVVQSQRMKGLMSASGEFFGPMKNPNRLGVGAVTTIGALVIGSWIGMGQEMVLPTHEVPSPDVAAEALQQDQPRLGWVKLGPFDIIPRFQSSVYYDDNIGAQDTNEQEAMVLTLAPTLEMVASDMEAGMGKRMKLSYTPGFLFFFGDDVDDRNRVNHTANVAGTLGGAKLSVGFDQRFMFTTGPVIDIGGTADRLAYTTRLTSQYLASDKTSIEVNGSYSVVDYREDIYTSTYNLANDNWLNYRYSPKLSLAMGVIIGYTGLEDQPDQTFQQLRLRAQYAIAEKVSLTASAGGEWRQYKSGIDDDLNPVWSLEAAYRPRDSTTLQLSFNQRFESSSRSGGQSYIYAGVTLRARQMLMQRLALNLSGTYSNSDYEATVEGVVADRDDDLILLRASLDFYIRPRWTAGLFYDYQTRDSTLPELDFVRNRVGLQTAWTY